MSHFHTISSTFICYPARLSCINVSLWCNTHVYCVLKCARAQVVSSKRRRNSPNKWQWNFIRTYFVWEWSNWYTGKSTRQLFGKNSWKMLTQYWADCQDIISIPTLLPSIIERSKYHFLRNWSKIGSICSITYFDVIRKGVENSCRVHGIGFNWK